MSFQSNGGSEVSGKDVILGQPYGELPTPTREGYVFAGWFIGEEPVTSSTIVKRKADHTLYAEWTEVKADFTIKDNMLVAYKGEGGDVVIPEGVTHIEGFLENTTVTSLTIGDNVTIGDVAVSRCTALTRVTIGDNAAIDTRAFLACPALASVTIGDGAAIGEIAFSGCESLTGVTLGKNAVIGEKAFSGCISLTSIALPEGATLEKQAFYKCDALTSVTFSRTGKIGESAFYK